MSGAKQKLTLALAQVILNEQDGDDLSALTDEQRRILGWYDQLDAVNRTILLTLMRPGGGHVAPQLEASPTSITPMLRESKTTQAKATVQARPAPKQKGPSSSSPPVKVYTEEELEQMFPNLPEETRARLEQVLTEGGVKVKSNNDNGKTDKSPADS